MAVSKREKIIFRELTGIPQATIVAGTDIANSFPRHVHSGYIFTVIDCGSREVKINSKSTKFEAGELCILPPGTPHSCESPDLCRTPHSYRALCVEAGYVQRTASQISGRACPAPDFDPMQSRRDFELDSFNEIFNLPDSPQTILEKQTALHSFLYHVILNYSCGEIIPEEIGLQEEALTRVKSYIEHNFMQRVTLEELAGVACISTFHLHKLFLKRFAVTPQEHLISCRVKKAERLLADGNAISETAIICGFSDQSHFSRHFKRVIGVSPGRFIKNNS